MSELLDLQEKLRDTSAAIAQAEQAVAKEHSASAVVMLKSFEKRRQVLEQEFQIRAASVGTDACSYRFLSDSVRPTVSPLCQALSDFQAAYSVVYDAIKHGAKKRSRKLPPDVLDESSFFFGYSFSGSVGVVLTFDNSKRELFGTTLDDSMEAVFSLASSKSSADVLEQGKRLGVPAVRAIHKWATAHADCALGADIQWKKGQQVMGRLLMQVPEMAQLADIIAGTSEVVEDNIDYVGRLARVDVDRRNFQLKLPDGTEIKGHFSEIIPRDRTFEVGATYAVTLKRRVKLYYSTEHEEGATYSLLLASVRTQDDLPMKSEAAG